MTHATAPSTPSTRIEEPLRSVTATHPGKIRDNNEDTVFSAPHQGVWLVADGMGGHEAGEVASAIVRDTFHDMIHSDADLDLAALIQTSHRRILTAAQQGLGALGMGSTVVAAQTTHSCAKIAWVGDSRAYCFDRLTQVLTQLTRDHSYVQELIDSGAIDSNDANDHPDKNVITQCLGMEGLHTVRVDVIEHQWGTHQWLLLCSDGLTDAVDDNTIRDLLIRASSIEKACDGLLDTALENGGPDNISIQLIESPLSALSDAINSSRQHTTTLTTIAQLTPRLTRNRRIDHWLFGLTLMGLTAALLVLLW